MTRVDLKIKLEGIEETNFISIDNPPLSVLFFLIHFFITNNGSCSLPWRRRKHRVEGMANPGRVLRPDTWFHPVRCSEHKRAHVGLPLSQPFSFAHAHYAHACATWITHDPVHTSGKYSFKRALKTGNREHFARTTLSSIYAARPFVDSIRWLDVDDLRSGWGGREERRLNIISSVRPVVVVVVVLLPSPLFLFLLSFYGKSSNDTFSARSAEWEETSRRNSRTKSKRDNVHRLCMQNEGEEDEGMKIEA